LRSDGSRGNIRPGAISLCAKAPLAMRPVVDAFHGMAMTETPPSRGELVRQRLTSKKAWFRTIRDFLMLAFGFILGPALFVFFIFPKQLWHLRRMLFSFHGRVTRKSFWWTFPIYFLYGAMVNAIIAVALPHASTTLYGVLLTAFAIAPIVVSATATAVRRLHDRNKSGRWLLVFCLVPVAIVGGSTGAAIPPAVYMLPVEIILIWAVIELGCRRGTVGPNKYGPELLAAPRRPAPSGGAGASARNTTR
jgi:uncharacterized membrane protein YhaH (DUF805 family)